MNTELLSESKQFLKQALENPLMDLGFRWARPVQKKIQPTPEQLYDAISFAETGSYKNPWMRTTSAPKRGSTAYGPVQITGGLVDDLVNEPNRFAGASGWSSEELRALQHLQYQKELFKKHGTSKYHPNKIKGYMKRFDYGGVGQYDPANRPHYRSAMIKAIGSMQKRQKTTNDFIKRWRGVSQKADPDYYDRVMSRLK